LPRHCLGCTRKMGQTHGGNMGLGSLNFVLKKIGGRIKGSRPTVLNSTILYSPFMVTPGYKSE